MTDLERTIPLVDALDLPMAEPADPTIPDGLFETMVRASADAMLAIDADGRVLFANDAAGRMFGVPTEVLVGSEFGLPLGTGDPIEVELHPISGTPGVAELRVARAGDVHVAMLRDVSQRVRLRTELQQLALADHMTGVGNRRAFLALAGKALKQATRDRRPCALLFVDVDDMKGLNDRYGHRVGDQAVISTAHMLTRTVRGSDVVARVGGDEFCVLLAGTPRPDSIDDAIARVTAAAAAVGDDLDFPLSVTVGVARFDPADPVELDELMHRADSAMYEVKTGRSRGPHT